MIVPADRTALRARGRAGSKLGIAFAAAVLPVIPTRAHAQTGAAVSVFSDYRFRGFSLSESRPVALLDLSYDAARGVYAAASGSVVAARGEGLRALGVAVNGGYAKQFASGLTVDVGATYARYSSYSGLGSSRSYGEFYSGVRGKILSSRLSLSPDYFGAGAALYGEVTGQISPARNVQLQAAVGVLAPLRGGYRVSPDGRVGLEWVTGRFSLHAAVTVRGGGRTFYRVRHSDHTAVVLGLGYPL